MNKKTKHATVSDFSLQLNAFTDSPFTRETTSDAELDLRVRDKIVIDFAPDTPLADADSRYAFNNASGSGRLWRRQREHCSNYYDNCYDDAESETGVYAFEEHAHTQLCDAGSASYHNNKQLALLNCATHLSLLRMDARSGVHHFRHLRRERGSVGDVHASASFFARRFDSLLLSTTLHSRVAIQDFEANKVIHEGCVEGAQTVCGWDVLYGVADARGRLRVFDVRDPAAAVAELHAGGSSSSTLRVTGTDKCEHAVIVSTERGTLLFDMRSLQHSHSVHTQQTQSVHCTKARFVAHDTAVVADFIDGTLSTLQLSTNSVLHTVAYGARLHDMAYCARTDRVAALLSDADDTPQLQLLDAALSLQQSTQLPRQRYTHVGFVGDRVLAHSRTHFAVAQPSHN